MKKKRMSKRKRQLIIMRRMILLGVVVLIAVIALIFILKPKVKSKVVLEAGSEIQLSDFLEKEYDEVSFVSDISSIDTTKPGEYEIEIAINKKSYKSFLTVQDTVAPAGTAVSVTTNVDVLPEASEFVTDIHDVTSVTVSYKNTPDVSTDGTRDVVIVLEDEGKNQTELTAELTVVSDSEAPVIEGTKDIEVFVGGTVAYKEGVTITDNMDDDPELSIDNSAVDLDTAGTYAVIYTATDSAGNSASVEITLTVSEKPKDYVDEETVNELAEGVLAQITDSSMSDMEKAFAIYRWVRSNIGYVNTSDKSSWVKGAYQGFQKKSGDCFNYFATAKALLNVAGIENVDVVKSDTSHSSHYWSLINLGDGWYHMDCTPRVGNGDNFFMVTDEELEAYSSAHNNSHVFDSSLYPERATVSLQDKVNYGSGTISD